MWALILALMGLGVGGGVAWAVRAADRRRSAVALPPPTKPPEPATSHPTRALEAKARGVSSYTHTKRPTKLATPAYTGAYTPAPEARREGGALLDALDIAATAYVYGKFADAVGSGDDSRDTPAPGGGGDFEGGGGEFGGAGAEGSW